MTTQTIEQSSEVDVPIAHAYNQGTQFEEFPRFMEGVERIDQRDDRHVHWVASFGGETHEWDAEITEQSPEERVAWRNVDGKDNAGVVTFHKVDDNTTRVMAQMDWAPEGHQGKAGRRARRRRPAAADGLASRLDPDLPVIVLSGRATDADRVRSFARGADDHLRKLTLHLFPRCRAAFAAGGCVYAGGASAGPANPRRRARSGRQLSSQRQRGAHPC